ncbi:phage tail spike protein [Streptococcus pseudopneumoniae]|uniref:phage tail spike protein n=1 Tax=Streptococcus pseudopneumoniae TaxID=257758 RepID=UPI00069E18A6|nr:phage tail spike protein [Streptococcus pseudopneumoniae]
MIYLTNGNMPLNAAYADEIVQEDNSTYQLSFRFPTSDPLWEKLKEETFLTADDLHGEQDFVIFEVEKKHGYIQVYANQVFTLLNNYVVNPISLDRQTGSTALSRFAGSITRDNPFSFFSDIEDRHTFNIGSKNAMEAFAKDKHSILGQWGGDLVRHGYQVRLLKNGGSENESLFMYKKNLSSYQHKTSTKSLKTRITFTTTVKGDEEKAPDRTFTVTIDSLLINKYSQIYEDVIEVNDQDVKDEASLRKYGEQYYRTSLCDMMEDSLEIEVVGQSDVPVQMFDIVSLFHEVYNLDVRKKITKYTYSPMAKKLKSIGFGQFQSGLANAIGNAVSDAVKDETQQLQGNFERQLARELKNANLAFDRQKEELVNQFTDGLNSTKARAEEVKQELSDTINQCFDSFENGPLQDAKRRAIEALQNAGASSLLAQEAKRIGLDSIAKLEEFKTQATSAQMTLSSDLDDLANEVLSKQEQIKDEVDEQVEALIQTKKELAGVKSAQATYEETTTRRLSELTNLAGGKASKSELIQTAEELASKIASVQASGRNLFLNSLFKQNISKTGIWTTSTYEAAIDSTDKYLGHNALKIVGQNPSGRDGGNPKITYPALGQFGKVIFGSTTNQDVTISFYAKANKNGIMLRSRLGNIWYKTGNVTLSTEIKRYVIHIPKSWTNESKQTTNEWLFDFNQEGTVWIWMPKFEISDVDTSYSEAPEDIDGRISTVESTFKQRADALDAGVNRLTEGLRTKADISSLNVTAENIRQSVKSLETSTQNKLDKKLSMAEFEVRASGIRQEIVNATKDKADKTLVVAEAGKLREEFSKMKVGSRNYAEDYDFSRGLWHYSQGDNSPQDWTISNGEYNVKGTTNTWKQMQINSKEGSRSSWKSSTALLDLELGETYTLSFQGICYSGSSSVWLSLRANRTVSGNPEIIPGTFNLTSSWQTYQVTIPALTKPDNFDFWRIILGYDGIGHVAFRKVELTRSSTRIDAGPAPEDGKTDLVVAKSEFQKTAEGLRTDLSAIQEYVNKDGQRQEALQRYTREESAKQATAVRELVAKDYVGKAVYQEDVKGINQKIEAVETSANKEIASQIASYRQSVDGKFTDISSQVTTYKQDVSGQISGLSNRLTSSEQGTTTQISNLSNRINSNKQGADNQISNLKTQVATNKDNAERQMGRISDQVSANKANADRQFSNVTNQLARKVETTDFQRVKETSQLYERILGNTENGIADKVARMAMTSQLFQVEVSKNEGLKTVQRQLADSWSVQNINSAGDLISGINFGANGHNRLDGKLTHITGETLIDKAVIKSAMIDKLKTANFEAGSVTTVVLDAEAVTAEKVKFDDAFIKRITAKDALIEGIISKQAFINHLNSITIDADRITGGNLSATNGAMKIDLNKGQYEVYTEKAAMRRVVAGYPNQFIKFDTGIQEVAGNRETKSGVTVIGSNSDGTENGNNQTFAGIQIWNNPQQRNVNSIGDYLRVSNKGFGENEKGWIIQTSDTPTIGPIVDKDKPETGKRSAILSGDFYFINKWGQKVSLLGILERFIVNFNTLRDKRGILYTDFSELN